jgi:repressor LexA
VLVAVSVGDGECGDMLITKSEIACWAKNMERKYTAKQGQYLAFIYYYTKLNDCPPAEADMQRYFKTTPPTVHSMVVNLEKLGLIERVPGQARTIRVLLPREELPDLD